MPDYIHYIALMMDQSGVDGSDNNITIYLSVTGFGQHVGDALSAMRYVIDLEVTATYNDCLKIKTRNLSEIAKNRLKTLILRSKVDQDHR